MPDSTEEKKGIFSDLKVDFPALLATNIFLTFSAVIAFNAIWKIQIDSDLKQTLVAIVMLAVGYYLGSSTGSKDASKTVRDVALGTRPPPPPTPAVPVVVAGSEPATVVTAWWSVLTEAERARLTAAAANDQRVAAFIAAAQDGKADTPDLAYLVSRNLLSADRAREVAAA